jgi:N-acetylglutamate synthase-like GNAT family acetyltransferase
VEKVVELARLRRSSELYLLTETAAQYFAARGFEIVSRDSAPDALKQSWEFKLGCPSSAKVLRRLLG